MVVGAMLLLDRTLEFARLIGLVAITTVEAAIGSNINQVGLLAATASIIDGKLDMIAGLSVHLGNG